MAQDGVRNGKRPPIVRNRSLIVPRAFFSGQRGTRQIELAVVERRDVAVVRLRREAR
jgi:hypothetical protein